MLIFQTLSWSVVQWLGRQTCDQKVARSKPGYALPG